MLDIKKLQVIATVMAWKTPLLVIAIVAAIGLPVVQHQGELEEPVQALHRVYNAASHYELCLITPHRPSK